MVKKVFGCFAVIFLMFSPASAQSAKSRWVDSVFLTLSLEEKIGQLFMIPVYSNKDQSHIDEIENKIKSHHVGGIIFMEGGPVRQVNMTNRLQALSAVPLLIAQDAEWGLGKTLDSTISFPRALVLGALQNDSLIYSMGSEIAREMKALGVHLNFAPTADITIDPENSFIGYRTFGENKINVANKSVAYMKGLQDNGIAACSKHFPIKGLTILDVQKGWPVLKPYIDSVQSYPFQKLFENGLMGVIPGAEDFPLFYDQKNLVKKNKFGSSALSSIFTGDWLKKQMNFQGLIFIDIPSIQTAAKKYRSGEAEMFAFQAGNDVLLSPMNIGQAIRKIKNLIKKNQQYKAQLDNSNKKILAIKYDAGLAEKKRINVDNLISRLNSPEAQLLNLKLHENAVTVVRNQQNYLPVRTLENKRFACLSTNGIGPNNMFHYYLSKYITSDYFISDSHTNYESLFSAIQNHEVIIVGIFPQTPESVIQKLIGLLKSLEDSHEVIVCDFGHETFLKYAGNLSTIVAAYTNSPEMLQAVPQVIFGGLSASSTIPFTPSADIKEGTGSQTNALNRFSFSIPEDAGMNSQTLAKIDLIAQEAINLHATPGCHVLVAKNGKIVYDKSFGYQTYENKAPVTDETIYDLASLTKVSATLQAVMFLYEKGMIDINKKASVYLPELKNTNKKDITIVDMLTHQAGLIPFIPLWPLTVKDSVYLPEYYSNVRSDHYNLQISSDLFAANTLKDSVWGWISNSKMQEKPPRTPYDYRYSDLGFMILQRMAEKILNQPLDEFLQQNFYEPLGANTTGFNPLNKFPQQTIAPTEEDKIYRKSTVVGTVHDERAAMMGGVSGHAGLFSNANDLAKLGQMLLQEGYYGNYTYFKPETIRLFTAKKFEKSRRGLGWDKPSPSDWSSPVSFLASPRTFGHTGFTGTCLWIDPEFNLVYIFLSNRVYPDRNTKLLNTNIRSRIQDVIYESIFHQCQFNNPSSSMDNPP